MENTNTKECSLIDELSEDRGGDKKIVKSFYSKDELSPDIFIKANNKYRIRDDVRNKLISIADNFLDFLGVKFFVYDVILTGSLSNFNWSEYSDVDLHIVSDFNEISGDNSDNPIMKDIIKEFFESKKNNWNTLHDVKIRSYDVELYVQDIHEKHLSSGVYSILNNKWIVIPEKSKEKIDEQLILDKGEEYGKIIDSLIERNDSGEDVSSEIDDIKQKIKKFRQTGLERGGEYSYENLTFKLLRRDGYIEKLFNLKRDVTNKNLSLNEQYDYSDIRKLEKRCLEEFGETDNFKVAGYLTPSGYLLDFSYGSSIRAEDHRIIGGLMNEVGIDIDFRTSGSRAVTLAMKMGFIRIMGENNSIEMFVKPTQEQFTKLRSIISSKRGRINVEMNEDSYMEYDYETPDYVILNDIKDYYNYGRKPAVHQYDNEDELYEQKIPVL